MSAESIAWVLDDRRFSGLDRFAMLHAADNGGRVSIEGLVEWANCSKEEASACLECLYAAGIVNFIEGRPVWSEIYIREHERDTAESRNYPPAFAISKSRRRAIYARDGFTCAYCGTAQNLSLDHVVPRSRGGADSDDNLVTCCRTCNTKKGARTPEEWRP